MKPRLVCIAVLLAASAGACGSRPRGIDVVEPAVKDEANLVPLNAVELQGFLGTRVAANAHNRLIHIPADQLIGGFQNRPLGSWTGEAAGKWIDAASLAWAQTENADLKERLDQIVEALLATQMEDGYLGTYSEEQRWTEWDVWIHKYVLLGLLRYHEVTRSPEALKAAREVANLICETFGPGKRDIVAAGTHVGMAATSILEPMVLLYRRTGEARYLGFAEYLIASWNQENGPGIIRTLLQERSVRKTANAKAYEMMSNLIGLCELYRTTADADYLDPVMVAWSDIVANHRYITGSGSVGEHFQEPHHFPNDQGHRVCETCVTVTWLQLNAQLYRLTAEPRYVAEMERSVYNHLLAAQRDDGAEWCYYTPLVGNKPMTPAVHCCSSSGQRGVALAPSIAFATNTEGITVNFYETAEAHLPSPSGQKVRVRVTSPYPGPGPAKLSLTLQQPERFAVQLRIPRWSRPTTLQLNEIRYQGSIKNGSYFVLDRSWKDGDEIELTFDFTPRTIPGTHSNAGHVAMMAGPLVLAYDSRDNASDAPPSTVGLEKVPDPRIVSVPETRADWPGQMQVQVNGFYAATGSARSSVPITLRDFASSGNEAAPFAVWLRSNDNRDPADVSLFFGAAEDSTQGSLLLDAFFTTCPFCDTQPIPSFSGLPAAGKRTNLTDGDPASFALALTDDRGESWFAVESDDAIAVRQIVFLHGTSSPYGGWFDTSGAKPKVWVKQDDGWRQVGVFDQYPETTFESAGTLEDGARFQLKLPRAQGISGIRVSGKGSRGDQSDNLPRPSFVSSGELQAFP